MYKIYVDSSDRKNNIVRLLKDEKTIDELQGDLDVATVIQNLLEKNSLKIQDISLFESFPGPGSFTGLKKSFAITNVLNWALGIKKSPTAFELPEYGKEPNIG